MKKLIRGTIVAMCATIFFAACGKEDISPMSNSLYVNLVSLWEQRTSPHWHGSVQKYVDRKGYTLYGDTLYTGYREITYLCPTDTAIYVLRTIDKDDTLWSLNCSIFSRRQRWMQDQIVLFEKEMYSRHPQDYTGGSFYWYTGVNSVDGGDVRTHDLFVQRAEEHVGDVWEWVEARTRYGLQPPYLGEDRLQLHTDGTKYYLNQLGMDADNGITHHLDIQFNTYDTTGWSNPFFY